MHGNSRPNLMLPTFLIPGVAKAGSSTLYECFASHPQILMSEGKEPAFFDVHWDEGLEYYAQFFRRYDDEQAIGEATPGYLVDPRAPRRIKSLLPDVKFVIALREPVSRAVSHYWWRVHRKIETRSFDEVLALGIEGYPIQFGLYHTQISRYLSFFPIEHMHFVLLDDLSRDPGAVLREALQFIGVHDEIPAPERYSANSAQTREAGSPPR